MANPVSLVKKLAEVMAAVERVPKHGRNDFHKYDYATEADIAATVRKELAARHVMLIPSIVNETRHVVGEKGSVLTVLEMLMEFHDGETGEIIGKPWRGYGSDKDDKGGYKAMTGGEKYFLLKTFLIPTGDDPEREDQRPRRTAVPLIVPAAPNRPPAPEGFVYLERIDTKETKTGRVYADVVLSTGETVMAFGQMVPLLEGLAQDQCAVKVELEKTKKGFLHIVEAHTADGLMTMAAAKMPPAKGDIPFS